MNKPFKLVIAGALLFAIGAASMSGQSQPGFDVSGMDTTVNACTDFYRYANGGWLQSNPIPAAYPSWGVANVLNEKTRELLHQILEDAARKTDARKGSNEQKVGDYYAACMDETKIEAEGSKPIQPELALIAAIKDQPSLQQEIAHLHSMGINVLFNAGSTTDFKNSKEVTAGLFQGGLGLPDRDFYTRTDDRTKATREEYRKHIAKMLELLGDDASKAGIEAEAIMNLETKLAAASKTRVELRDPEKLYHRMPIDSVRELSPTFDWPLYFKRIGLSQKVDVNVATPDFFKAMDVELTARSIPDWQIYLRWHLVNNMASGLSSAFVDEDFHFKGTVIQGNKENLPRWKRCVTATDRALGEALGQIYAQKAFPAAAKARALEMVHNLEAALKSDISTLSWMSETTRRQAIIKLDAFANKIGYPDKWRDYSSLSIDRTSYVSNRMRVGEFNNLRDLAKISKPVDKTEWGMTPPTLNAQYNPQFNDITFPAGILQPPYFDAHADDALNYGGIGSIIGHEMTHGFDDQGAQFDATGNLANWWSDTDLKAFKERALCVADQFSSFQVEPGLNENGKLVLGESIADLGGVLIAYAAFQKSMEGKPRPPSIDGFTPEQRFFLGYARGWATNTRPETERLLTTTDPHPLARFRVNGPLSNLPQFAMAFGCKTGDPMVRPEKDRCQIW